MGNVIHVNAYTYYEIGHRIHDLTVVQVNIVCNPDVIAVLVRGRDALNEFVANEDPVRFRSSIDAARNSQPVWI